MADDSDRWRKVRGLFDQAVELAPAARTAWLDVACGSDRELRREVEDLLAADGDDASAISDGDPLVEAIAGAARDRLASPLLDAFEGRRLGAYRLERELGRGGMGVVYLARRDDREFEKRVAVKLLDGVVQQAALGRFRQERQVLARLEHPAVARLLDGGTTEEGLPFLVMEHVEGERIDRYCEQRRLDVHTRLELFLEVCEAVRYAHANLIVHRDLKPGNILVTEEGRPKLLDFGIAKLLVGDGGEPEEAGATAEGEDDLRGSHDLPRAAHGRRSLGALRPPATAVTVSPPVPANVIAKRLHELPSADEGTVQLTGTVHRVFTPRYASPEQIRGESVTTASDVYSLGVLLYELLTAVSPYGHEATDSASVQRAVLEGEPVPPSAAVLGAKERGADHAVVSDSGLAAERERAHQTSLSRELRGDLDAIVLRAMQKSPAARYPSVEQLAADVRRHLRGLPVEARPATLRYRAGRFVRRHRVGVAAAAAFVALIVAFAVAMTVSSWRLAAERDRALRAEAHAHTEAESAREVADFLVGLFDASTPNEARGAAVTARELVDRGAERIQSDSELSPAIRRRLQAALGAVYRYLGLFDQSAALLVGVQEELAPPGVDAATHLHDDDVETFVKVLVELAAVRWEQGLTDESKTLNDLGLELSRARLGPSHPRVALFLHNLGWIVQERGEYQQALDLHRQGLAIRESIPGLEPDEVAASQNYLGSTLIAVGDYDGAVSTLRTAFESRVDNLGEDHPGTLTTRNNLAVALQERGRPEDLAEAESHYRAVVAAERLAYDEDSPQRSTSLVTLARLLRHRSTPEALDEAESLLDEAIALDRRRTDGAVWVGYDLAILADVLARRGDGEQAETMLREALGLYAGAGAEAAAPRAVAQRQLGALLVDRDAAGEAEPLLREALAAREASLPQDHPEVALTRLELGRCLIELGRRAEGAELVRAAHASLETSFGADDARTSRAATLVAALEP